MKFIMPAARFLNDDFIIKENSLTHLRPLLKEDHEKYRTLLQFVRIKYNGWVRSMADSTQKNFIKVHQIL
jgi:hypothetical protein